MVYLCDNDIISVHTSDSYIPQSRRQKNIFICFNPNFLFGSVITIFLRSGYFSILEKIIDKMKVAHTLGFVFLYLTGGFIKKFKITNLNLAFVL